MAALAAADATGVAAAPTVWVLLPALILWLWCLADVVQTDEQVVRMFSKQQWIFMVVLTSVFGGLLWLAFGRPHRPRS